MSCRAYRVSDQMMCPHCRLVWDINDPEPPPCGKDDKEAKPDKPAKKPRNPKR